MGKGYKRSSHMEKNVGPHSSSGGTGGGQEPHSNLLHSGEDKEHGSNHKLPGEKHIGFRKGIDPGDSFEQEVKEHFPGKGVAGIKKTAMPQGNSPVQHVTSGTPGHASGKAEHHPHMGGEGYKFPSPMTSSAHGFGHSDSQRCGPLRTSGHPGGHQIGKRK